MRLAGLPAIHAFTAKNPDSQAPLEAWIAEASVAKWRTPHDLKRAFPKASLVKDGRVVFNIRGNRFRLDVLVNYHYQQILIMRVGTHRDYDSWTF
jgi:mRNA interferase HigB